MPGALVATALVLLQLPSFGQVATAPLRVRGTSSVEALATKVQGGLSVRGMVVDDTGRPIPGAALSLKWVPPADAATRALPAPKACPGRTAPAAHLKCAREECAWSAEETGAFCVVYESNEASGALLIRFADKTERFSPSALQLSLDNRRRTLQLSTGPGNTLELERPQHGLRIDTQVLPPFEVGESRERLQLELLLRRDNNEARIATTGLYPGESTQFELQASALGAPGQAELLVRFAGSETLEAAEDRTQVLVTARVALSIAGGPLRGDALDGIPLRVAVGSVVGAVPNGSVEATFAGNTVGIANVNDGTAELLLRFEARPGVVPIALHYLPSSPWWRAGAPTEAELEVLPPNPWRRLPWILGALGGAAWILWLWRRPGRTELTRPASTAAEPRIGIQLVETGRGHAGWDGSVRDAHDNTPVAAAKLQIIVPTFGASGLVQTAFTDASGRFHLPSIDLSTREGVVMRVSSPWHATLERPLSAEGTLQIGIVLRRRALLDRWTAWLRFAGTPWNRWVDPTPGQIRVEAIGRGASDVARFATALEEAVYGAEPVDENIERSVEALEPSAGRAPRAGSSADTERI